MAYGYGLQTTRQNCSSVDIGKEFGIPGSKNDHITECETNQSPLKSVLRQLVQFNRVAATDVDDILHQYQDYADSMIHDLQELFTIFSPSVSRLDTLTVDTVSRNDSCSKPWKVVKMLLVLSHGQATVE